MYLKQSVIPVHLGVAPEPGVDGIRRGSIFRNKGKGLLTPNHAAVFVFDFQGLGRIQQALCRRVDFILVVEIQLAVHFLIFLPSGFGCALLGGVKIVGPGGTASRAECENQSQDPGYHTVMFHKNLLNWVRRKSGWDLRLRGPRDLEPVRESKQEAAALCR